VISTPGITRVLVTEDTNVGLFPVRVGQLGQEESVCKQTVA